MEAEKMKKYKNISFLQTSRHIPACFIMYLWMGKWLPFSMAARKSRFRVWYQPKVEMRTGKIIGAEALIRWETETGKILLPANFVPIFEKTGQIVELDAEVVRLVCNDICDARRKNICMGNISVNLSKIHISKPGIIEKIRDLTTNSKITGDELSFEITESVTEGKDKDKLTELVEKIHEMGFSVHIDDFGTGSSTLHSLAHTCFDVLKIDRSFVKRVGDPRTDIILISTIHMAECLEMEVVAEGVETEEQVEFLVNNGCNIAQGFYFSKPLSREDFFSVLKEERITFR